MQNNTAIDLFWMEGSAKDDPSGDLPVLKDDIMSRSIATYGNTFGACYYQAIKGDPPLQRGIHGDLLVYKSE